MRIFVQKEMWEIFLCKETVFEWLESSWRFQISVCFFNKPNFVSQKFIFCGCWVFLVTKVNFKMSLTMLWGELECPCPRHCLSLVWSWWCAVKALVRTSRSSWSIIVLPRNMVQLAKELECYAICSGMVWCISRELVYGTSCGSWAVAGSKLKWMGVLLPGIGQQRWAIESMCC